MCVYVRVCSWCGVWEGQAARPVTKVSAEPDVTMSTWAHGVAAWVHRVAAWVHGLSPGYTGLQPRDIGLQPDVTKRTLPRRLRPMHLRTSKHLR